MLFLEFSEPNFRQLAKLCQVAIDQEIKKCILLLESKTAKVISVGRIGGNRRRLYASLFKSNKSGSNTAQRMKFSVKLHNLLTCLQPCT